MHYKVSIMKLAVLIITCRQLEAAFNNNHDDDDDDHDVAVCQ